MGSSTEFCVCSRYDDYAQTVILYIPEFFRAPFPCIPFAHFSAYYKNCYLAVVLTAILYNV